VAAVLVLGLHCSAVLAEVRYTVTDLGTFGGNGRAWSINDEGVIVGQSYKAGIMRPFRWTSSTGMVELPTVPGTDGRAWCINNRGESVGEAFYYYSPCPYYALMWNAAGGMTDLGYLAGTNSSEAHGINDSGWTVGASFTIGTSGRKAFRNDGVAMSDLGSLGGTDSEAYAINNSGEIVGVSGTTGNAAFHAFLWNGSTGMQDLGTIGGESNGRAINEHGHVAGYSDPTADTRHAFLWTPQEGMQDLGTLSGRTHTEAYGINDGDEVVGTSYSIGGGTVHAFLWDAKNGMQDLNNLVDPSCGWTLFAANDINNTGCIVGFGLQAGSNYHHPVLLTPIPEPATLALLALGGLVALRRRR
jgi:probable HAF family extracellular repeat protein